MTENIHGRIYSTGKRKTAIARVYMSPGTGQFKVNGRLLDEYFGRPTLRMILMQPLEATDTKNQYDFFIGVTGGGLSGQAGAIRHGISRALALVSPERRAVLKKGGFLTRDARIKERKKYGQPGARKRFQYSKR
jgi:small subunit ribosomal protein S9